MNPIVLNFKKILECVAKAEKTKYAKPTEMFLDIYDKPTALLEKQRKEFLDHLKANSKNYPMDAYEKI